ncbi:queuosine precursor transporter, partial [Candidatus Daviesbacteria bacterium]|nr:queuosine precursor transporter [Candidatus Daviesbacteria bacterium]
IVLASITAYFMGEFVNSVILSKLKIVTDGKWLWSRTIGSTLAGQFIDTLIFIIIAFAGVLPFELLVSLVISNYLFKTGVEVLFTPITYKVVNFLKKAEKEDHFDKNIAYTPV